MTLLVTVAVDPAWTRWPLLLVLFGAVVYRNRDAFHWARTATEVAIALGAYFAYFLVRGATEGSRETAIANAQSIIDLERRLGFYWEPWLQRQIIDNQALVTLANWAYIWGHWTVIIAVAVWLYLQDSPRYVLFRNAFLISGAIGLVIFATYPVAPPRIGSPEVVDTVTEYSRSYRTLQPPALINQYAAVPSLHFGWNLLIGIALFRELRPAWARALSIALPAVMLAAIVLTANHYIFDALAGAIVALFGLAVASAVALPPVEGPGPELQQAR